MKTKENNVRGFHGLRGLRICEIQGMRSMPVIRVIRGPIFLLLVLLTGCSTLVHKSGELLEGKAFAEKIFALYRSPAKGRETVFEIKELKTKDGQELLEITNSEWPSLALRGNKPGASRRLELTEARFLSSHVNGWNEFTLDLLGHAFFSESHGLFSISEEVERVHISSGKIRLKSNRLTGDGALSSLRNRRERILALTEWMGKYEQTGLVNQSVFANQKEFEKYWKPLLFPELVSKKKRPTDYSAENAEWRRADSVKWNKSYTQLLFPEELWELRNSGALLRDWEEALPWIYMEYKWDSIIGSFYEKNLVRIK